MGHYVFCEERPADHCMHHIFQGYHLFIVGLWWVVERSTVTNIVLVLRVATERVAFSRQEAWQLSSATEEEEKYQSV